MNTTSPHLLPRHPRAVLFDMDGVLYDSMPRHAASWLEMCRLHGIHAEYDEFFGYEGRTGASTISLLFRREFGRDATEQECKDLYAVKSRIFASMGRAPVMPGALEAVRAVVHAGATPVLVTGSGQLTLLERLNADFGGAFPAERRVTAHDVRHGKPDPEPYLAGLAKAGVEADCAVAVDNAPLGVLSASRAGIYTIGARTGPLPASELKENGADIVLEGMERVAAYLENILRPEH